LISGRIAAGRSLQKSGPKRLGRKRRKMVNKKRGTKLARIKCPSP